jgi:zinc protease
MTVLVAAPPGVTSLDALAARLPPALRGDPQHRIARLAPAPEVPGAAPAGASRVEHRSSPLPTPELWLGWRLPGAIGDARATEEVLARWLQQDVASDQVLQEEPKIRRVRVEFQPGARASLLLLRVLVAPGASADKVAQVVVARVASLWSREPASQDTFAELRGLFETQQLFEEPPQVARALDEAMVAATSERALPAADSWAELQAVKSAAVAKLAYEQLGREKVRAVMFTPAAPGPDVAQRAAAPGAAAPEGARELVPGASAWDARELDAFAPEPDEVTTKTLDNGLTVVTVVREGKAAVAWLAFRGGYSDAEPPLLAELAVRARPDAQQSTRLHILAGRGATRDFTWDMVQFLPAQLPEALTLLFAKAIVPVKSWPSAEGLARMLAPLAAEEDALSTESDAAFWRALFGDHPHARAVKTTDVEKLTRSDVEAWLGRVHATRNAALVVVGDVDPDEVERAAKILSAHIKSPAWVADLATPPAVAPRAAGADHVVPVLTARPGALTDVRVGCLLPPMSAADAGPYDALKNAMKARLDDALRFEHGDSYGVGVEVHRLRGGTTFLVAETSVAADALTRSLRAVRANWQRWARAGFGEDEMNVARWRFGASLPFRDASDAAVAVQLLDRWAVNPAELAAGPVEASVFPDARAFQTKRVGELFATCKSNTVLGLTGSEPLIQRALEQGWPGLAARPRAAP